MAKTYATFDPLQTVNVALSGGDLVATTTANGGALVLANQGVSSGRHYWEYTVTSGDSYYALGIGQSPVTSLGAWLGANAGTGWAYWSDGNKTPYATPYGAAFTTGNVIRCMLDMDVGTLEFYLEDVSEGIAFTGLTGTWYPGWSCYNTGAVLTANFGASPFSYSVPAGFNSGVYIGSSTNTQTVGGSLSFSGGLSRLTFKNLAGALAFTGIISRAAHKSVSGSLSFFGALSKAGSKTLRGTLSFSGVVVRAAGGLIAAVIAKIGFVNSRRSMIFTQAERKMTFTQIKRSATFRKVP